MKQFITDFRNSLPYLKGNYAWETATPFLRIFTR